MTTMREGFIALLADKPTSPPLMKYLGKTRAALEAMPDDELFALLEPAQNFLHESGTLAMRAAAILEELATLAGRPCLVNDLAHREQRRRDLIDEHNRITRRLITEYFADPALLAIGKRPDRKAEVRR